MNFQPVKFISGLNISEEKILENIRLNCARSIPRVNVKKAVICGGGPSLADHIEEIRFKKDRGFHIYALNNAGNFLKQNGIQPNAVFIIDARPENIGFINPIDPEISYFVGSQCDPSLFDALSGHDKTYMIHVLAVEGAQEIISELNPGSSILTSAPTVGLQALNLLHVLGYKIVHLYGYDSSYRGDAHHAYPQELNDNQKLHEFVFRGTPYVSSGPMASQADQFCINYRKYTSQGMDLQVIGDGLLPAMYAYHEDLRINGSLEDREAIKYQKMWSIKDYRRTAPGEELVDQFVSGCAIPAEASIIDFGCGTGRPAQMLHDRGFKVTGIDHALNCRDEGCTFDFRVENLWKLPDSLKCDYGFCTDVMEHIPTEKVDDVLSGIANAVRDSAFFAISFHDDSFGNYVGERLHLTVRDHNWWVEKLERFFSQIQSVGSDEEWRGNFICRK